MRVFLVEDDARVASSVLEGLAATPHIVAVGHAATLSQARAVLKQACPDVLLADLQLPDGDGSDLIREARTQNLAKAILVFSVFGDEHRVIGAIEAGADGYILKGCTDAELIEALERASKGESPISPAIARHVLKRLRAADPPAPAHPAPEDALSQREVDVLKLVAHGFIPDEIGDRLNISPHTVRTHIRHIYEKLRVSRRGQAVFEGQRRGYL
ncbi:MAG: response regulator transcription factor [Burkholderiales bacterium]|nr:response regulator transcription factor [Burkholderiales bacterium]